ncbi:MAG: ATP-binding cassette domain-containing protein [bacterium]
MGNFLLEMRHISKRFGSVQALSNVDLDLGSPEVLGLVGDNAAGKSTLMKILSGVYPPDEGKIIVKDQEVKIHSPRDARNLGIWMVFQDLALIEDLSVTENMFLGRELESSVLGIKFRDIRKMRRRTRGILKSLSVAIGERRKVRLLSGGQRAEVAIGRTLIESPRVIIMDEPTAPLGVEAVKRLLLVIKDLKAKGHSIIFISHRLEDVFTVSDRIMVLRTGRKVACKKKDEVTREEIVDHMMGVRRNKNN